MGAHLLTFTKMASLLRLMLYRFKERKVLWSDNKYVFTETYIKNGEVK